MDQNIQKELDAHHITLAIVDTDCRYSGSPINSQSTYGKCIGIGAGNVLYKLVSLDVHEIENLIPLNYIDMAYASWTGNTAEYQEKKKAFDFLKKDAENILPYFDYKNGIKYNDGYRNAQQGYRDFAELCYMQNDEKVAMQSDFRLFVSGLNDKDIIYSNLIGGTGTINMTLKLIENGNAPTPALYNFQRTNWEKIGQVMLNWCIARSPEAIH